MKFSEYQDFDDFISKMGFTLGEGITFLDDELKKLREGKVKNGMQLY